MDFIICWIAVSSNATPVRPYWQDAQADQRSKVLSFLANLGADKPKPFGAVYALRSQYNLRRQLPPNLRRQK
jgi:hypothetical protein